MSIQRSVRKAEQDKELDRGGWADLDKIQYALGIVCDSDPVILFEGTVNFEGLALKGYGSVRPIHPFASPNQIDLQNGEAISGPYWFGRAFDVPPFFTFSVVNRVEGSTAQVTIGVSEWHQDEFGMYVGASLWMKAVCFQSGDGPFQPGDGPCVENRITGDNILRDPSFESHFVLPKGPGGLTFPGDAFGTGGANPGSLYWHVTNITDTSYYDKNGWAVSSNNVGVLGVPPPHPTPILSTNNPRTGKYHWRVVYPDNQDWSGAVTYPIPVGGRYCALKGGLIQAYTARVNSGDTITAWFHAMVNSLADGPHFAWVEMTFFDKNADSLGNVATSDLLLGTTYKKYEKEAIAPSDAYTVAVEYGLDAARVIDSGPLHVDVDDCGVGVNP